MYQSLRDLAQTTSELHTAHMIPWQ